MEQAKSDFPDIRTFTRVEDLLAQPDIDLVTVITPHNTHAPLAEQVLNSGKHCILEKPMCIHADDADKLVQLSREKGLMVSVYHNRRWDGWYLTLKDLIGKGLIGDIFHVEMYMGGYRQPGSWWRSDKEISGGAFYDWGAHYIDYLLGVMPGKIKSVRGFIHNLVWHETTNEDHIDSILEFENGAVAHIQSSSIAHAGKPAFRFLGTKGAIVDVNMWDGQLTYYTDLNGVKVETNVPCLKDNQEEYYRNIADHLMNGAELIVKPEQARRTIAVIETTEKSAASGQALPVPFE
jgi:scyllo-inositol 2-dehydrogenase (NADP+)